MTKNSVLSLESNITGLKGFGPKKAQLMEKLGLRRLGDMLWYYPRGYEDRRKLVNICDLKDGERALTKA